MGEVRAVNEGVGVLRAADAFPDWQQGSELVARRRRIPCLAGPAGEAVADEEGLGMRRAHVWSASSGSAR